MITNSEIKKAIQKLRCSSLKADNGYFIVPLAERVLSKRYRKRGRPRKTDYDFIEIDWFNILNIE